MSSSSTLNSWLRKVPQPVAVLVEDADGREQRVEVGKGARLWAELTKTVEALQPAKLSCLDAKGSIIRSINVEVEGAASEDTKTKIKSQLGEFAALIAGAYDKATANVQPLLNNSMEFIDRQAARLAKSEAEIERLRAVNNELVRQVNELTLGTPEGSENSVLGLLANALNAAQQQPQKKTLRAVAKPDGAK